MAKRKAKPKSTEPTIADLVALAREVGLSDDALDGDLQDAAEEEAQLIFENVKSETLYEQLHFLHMHGYSLERLAEIIRETSGKDGK